MKTRQLITALVGLGTILLITAYLLYTRGTPSPATGAALPSVSTTPTPIPRTTPTLPSPAAPASVSSTMPTPTHSPSSPPPNAGTDHTDTNTDHATPQPPTAGEQDAINIAVEFATRFARPAAGITHQQWWSQVAALMTSQAQADYRDVDPATIPYTAVTGAGAIQPSGADHSDLVTLVSVPTTAGTYLVHLRINPTRGWAVNQVTAPARLP